MPIPSAASKMPVIPGQRLAPPENLDPFEKAQWESITAGLPPGWILPEHAPIMVQLTRHTKLAHHFAAVLARLLELSVEWKPDDERWNQVRAMSKAHATETAGIIACSKSLRISKLAARPERAEAKLRRSSATQIRPWNDWGEGRVVTNEKGGRA